MLLGIAVLTFVAVAISPARNSVVKNYEYSSCTADEFRCSDGTCVSLTLLCDGERACADGSDEARCDGTDSLVPFLQPELHRTKRQTRCASGKWRCKDGQCIDSDGKCDGIKNCSDGSDETHALCRNINCPDYLFRCAYGACVDGYGKCNKEKNCVDNSDELHPDCFQGDSSISNGKFKCTDGSTISSTAACDGKADCADGSDESVRACGATRCHSIHFQCAYGACVDTGSDCDGKVDCADGSDEADDLCNRQGAATAAPTAPPAPVTPAPPGDCLLPPYPAHGRYTVEGNPQVRPGQSLQVAYVNVTCDPGYRLSETDKLFCFGTFGWSSPFPTCIRYCRLNPHKSVSYRCIASDTQGGTRACQELVPSGTQVIPTCNSPNYYSRFPLQYMNCIDGTWDKIETCEPECGKITPDGVAFVIDGWPAKKGEFPWHVGIYRKDVRPYKQICGGSIVSTTLVISAAHCFYTDSEKLRPASKYAVAAGKLYRPWNDPNDVDAQKSDVSDIKITERFRGSSNNYQEDIALVFVSTPFEYKTYVRPVCLDFEYNFNTAQLSPGNYGRVAGWGLTKEEGTASQILLTVNLPFVPPGKCIDESPPGFHEYITGDKFCAGYTNGTSLCQGDSGGGLVFPSTERSTTRYYLRGIVSTGPRNLEFTSCESHFYTTFTELDKHEMFIRPFYNRS